MLESYKYLVVSYLAITATLIAVFGYIAATESDSPRKGRAKLIATLAFASWFIAVPVAQSSYESKLPVYEFSGVITTVRVVDQSTKYYSAWLTIQTTVAGVVTVHVSEPSKAWVTGQNLRIRYYCGTGEMVRAELLDADGRQTGVVDRTANFNRYLLILTGLFLCWVGFKVYRRDPKDAEVAPDRSSLSTDNPLGLGQDSLTQSELKQMKDDGRQQLATQKTRALITGAAFIASCGLVYLISAGHSLHHYWESVGAIVLAVTFALMLIFTISAIAAVGTWLYVRNLEKDEP